MSRNPSLENSDHSNDLSGVRTCESDILRHLSISSIEFPDRLDRFFVDLYGSDAISTWLLLKFPYRGLKGVSSLVRTRRGTVATPTYNFLGAVALMLCQRLPQSFAT